MAMPPVATPPVATPPRRPHHVTALLLPGMAAVVLLVDQITKGWVQRELQPCDGGGSVSIVKDWLQLTYTCNRGAAFGVLANETLLFVLIAIVVVGVIVAYFRFLPAGRPWLRLSLGLQLGGALGNLIDRLRQGFVVDFISVKSAPVFNVADTCIVVGVLILAYYLVIAPSPAPADAPSRRASLAAGDEQESVGGLSQR